MNHTDVSLLVWVLLADPILLVIVLMTLLVGLTFCGSLIYQSRHKTEHPNFEEGRRRRLNEDMHREYRNLVAQSYAAFDAGRQPLAIKLLADAIRLDLTIGAGYPGEVERVSQEMFESAVALANAMLDQRATSN